MSSNGSPTVNISDPLCVLPPELAFQQMTARYILVGTLGAFVWDVLNNVLNDYKLLSKHQIRSPTVVYFISRLCCFGYIISATIFQTTPVHACKVIGKSDSVLFSGAVIFTSLLFFFRTRAVFNENPWIVALFAGLWLAVVAGCLTTIVGVSAVNIGQTGYCMGGEIKPFASAAAIIPLINDTLVFLAITWRISCNSSAHRTLKGGFRVLIFGDYLPAFSRAMLQDGQVYYMTTIAVNLVAVIMLFNSSVPDNTRTIFMVPNVVLMNMMACRVYRNLRLGFFKETQTSTSDLKFASRATIPLSLWRGESSGTGSAKQAGGATLDIDGIAATQTVERIYECAV